MDQWLFLRVTEEHGTGWRWERHDEAGNIVEAGARTFADYRRRSATR